MNNNPRPPSQVSSKQQAARVPVEVTKSDILETLKAFSLVLDRDMDGIVTVAALQTFYKSIGETVDTPTAKELIKDLQVRCGCKKQVCSLVGWSVEFVEFGSIAWMVGGMHN